MKETSPRNIAASVHARLKNLSRATGRSFNELLQYYGMERFIARLAQSDFVENFILKGALLLRVYDVRIERPTRDIDLLGRLDGAPEVIVPAIAECLRIPADDGILFDEQSLKAVPIKPEAEYGGMRITFAGNLGNARLALQIDIGIGDVVYPEPVWVEYPSLLDSEPLRLRAYTLESVVAEKYHALCVLGLANSRMKDFFDLHYLITQRRFSGERVVEAIRRTFGRRDTTFSDTTPDALTEKFWGREDKVIQWRAFLRKNRFEEQALEDICREIRRFFEEVQGALVHDQAFPFTWPPGGPWRVEQP